jgi:uncharacterized NAD(P)/FAD-binding protein YdhS/tetratricopeptide (TPR) repeat protein
VAVVGAGAAGALTAARLLDRAGRRGILLDVLLVDPGAAPGRGVAYGTDEPRHLLNIPARAISADPDDPEDFLRWLAARGEWADPYSFQPRARYGCYLADLLTQSAAEAGPVGALIRRRDRVTGLAQYGPRALTLSLASGSTVAADAAVLALGQYPPGTAWAPDALRESPRFIADPWAPGALTAVPEDGDVLLVGTGLTMVDVTLALDRPGRALHAVSRNGLVPQVHSSQPLESVAPPPLDDCADLAALRRVVLRHINAHRREHGDWRPAFDSLRPATSRIWQRFTPAEQEQFLTRDSRWWETHRHRIAPVTGAILRNIQLAGRLDVAAGSVVSAEPATDGRALLVRLSDGRQLRVSAVVNCTGPEIDFRRCDDPLPSALFQAGQARSGPLGLGLDTASDGRVLDAHGQAHLPLWTLGAARRGSLWESTAIPELRVQALELASSVLDYSSRRESIPVSGPGPAQAKAQSPLQTQTQSRPQAQIQTTPPPIPPAAVAWRAPFPRDRYGLRLSTTAAAASAFQAGLDRVLLLADGAAEQFERAVAFDPRFAVGHAALALIGFEWGVAVDVPAALAAARQAAELGGDDRERSFVAAVIARAGDPVCADADSPGARALLRHIRDYPRDALAVSVAVPTVAFGGITSGERTWELVERLGPVYGHDWWYSGELAFVRQEQGRWDEAEELATAALAEQPASGHAVHARSHVFYETGRHAAGLAWLDDWIGHNGPQTNNCAHFSWHAAIHELALDDAAAVRRRYERQLAPPKVTGTRAMVDSGSLLWRCHVVSRWSGQLPTAELAAVADADWMRTPPNPFAALHGALALALNDDASGLHTLRRWATRHRKPVFREVVAPLCDGLCAVVEEQWDDAVATLRPLMPRLNELQGSYAQTEVVEETLLYALINAGQTAQAADLITARLDRRPSELDRNLLNALRSTQRLAGR